MLIEIKNGNIKDAISIINEAAQWLNEKNQQMWKLEDLTEEKILNGITKENIYVLYINNEPAATMILKWDDKLFWPNIKSYESGFIHKLSVRRKYAGKSIACKLIEYAENGCKLRNIDYLRLDCAGDRPKLCHFYVKNGFKIVKKEMIGSHYTAFFEKRI